MPKLTEELRQALTEHAGWPLEIEDPITQTRYVLVRRDEYERLQRLDYDASDPNPQDFYPAFAKAVKDELDASDTNGYKPTPRDRQP